MCSVGDYVFDKTKNERVQILEISEVWGFVSYKVFNASTGTVYKLSAADICAEVPEENFNESYLRYVAMHSRTKPPKASCQSYRAASFLCRTSCMFLTGLYQTIM